MTATGRRPRLLVIAFACQPGRGSEPGAGWGMVQALSTIADCVVLVGHSHAEAITEWQRTLGTTGSLSFVVVREGWEGSALERGRLGWLMAYLRWLPRAAATAKALHAEHPFDAVCHATYSTYWLPTPGMGLGIPCLWGPVGGAVVTPLPLWRALGIRGIVEELIDYFGVHAFAALPATRRTWKGVAWRVVQNRATLLRLPPGVRDRTTVLNHALFTETGPVPARRPGHRLLFVAGLETRKGLWLVLSALARTPATVSLVVVGDGPERGRLERLARRLGVADRVEFRGRMPRAQVMEMFAAAAASVFAGLREEGGLTLAEAMLCGCPVIVLAHGGPSAILDYATDPSRIALIPPGGIDETSRLLAESMTRFALQPPAATGPLLDQERATGDLAVLLRRVLAATI